MADLPRCRLTTWSDVDRWADRLAERIRSEQAVPEIIIALTRGGWVPSRLLCDRLGVRRLVSVRAQHWGVTATPDGTAKLTEGLSGPVEGQKVLVVDDITDTGESLSLATAHVAEQHPARLETAAFLHIAHSKFLPTYFAEEIPRAGWVWVVFPWNYWEDLAALATKAAEFGRGVSTIRETLRTRSGLDVPLADLERVADLVPIR
jgi:hypoxanthine phosphoribosyltransferase